MSFQLLYFKLVGVLYPTSDLYHHVVTPTALFMSQVLTQVSQVLTQVSQLLTQVSQVFTQVTQVFTQISQVSRS